MTPYILGLLFGVVCFIGGFLVGKKNGERLAKAAGSLADTIKKA